MRENVQRKLFKTHLTFNALLKVSSVELRKTISPGTHHTLHAVYWYTERNSLGHVIFLSTMVISLCRGVFICIRPRGNEGIFLADSDDIYSLQPPHSCSFNFT